jgi:hypothetical protein
VAYVATSRSRSERLGCGYVRLVKKAKPNFSFCSFLSLFALFTLYHMIELYLLHLLLTLFQGEPARTL